MTDRTVALVPSVPEAIERILRERILAGDLGPDTPLRETALAEEFDVSRHTVREALLLLDRAGLAYRRSHRGTRVTVPDRDHLRDVMAFRRVVEPGAARLVGPDHAALDELRVIAGELEAAAAGRDWDGYGALDRAFHTKLVAAGGSIRLAREFAGVIDELRLHFNELDRAAPPDSHEHVVEHAEIVEALAADDMDRALRVLESHLADAEQRLLGEGE